MKRTVIISDLDGTLADLGHRRHLVERPRQCNTCHGFTFVCTPDQCHGAGFKGGPNHVPDFKPDWDGFHAACVNDTLLVDTARVLVNLQRGFRQAENLELWIVSGRMETVRHQTERWLFSNGIYQTRLIMRPEGDYTRDDELKKRWLNDGTLPPKEQILCVFDDRDRVVKMWRAEGLTCYQVAPGDF